MLASILGTTLLLDAQASNFASAEDEAQAGAGTAVLLVCVLFGVFWLTLKLLTPTAEKPHSPRSSRRPVLIETRPTKRQGTPRQSVAAATAPPGACRIISLYAVTPGQLPHEYNVGDRSGTRGLASVNASVNAANRAPSWHRT